MKNKQNKKSNRLIVLLIGLIFILNLLNFIDNKSVVAQSYDIPNIIRIGIDNSAKEVCYFEDMNNNEKLESNEVHGFCKVFGEELKTYLHNKTLKDYEVQYTLIDNKYLEGVNQQYHQKYHRYDSLKAEHKEKAFFQHIICGANSDFTKILNQGTIVRNGWSHVKFSDSFHDTGIKILLKKDSDIYKQLKQIPINDAPKIFDFLKDKPIIVVDETVTLYQLKNTLKHNIYNVFSFRKRSEALDKLMSNDSFLYASDTPILKTLLEENGYSDKYVIYPFESGVYLPETRTEQYAIAISNEIEDFPYNDDLMTAINDLLGKNTEIKKEIDKLREPRKINLWQMVVSLIVLLATCYWAYHVHRDPNLRQEALSRFTVVIMGLLTALTPWTVSLITSLITSLIGK
ncbi:MAG: hypothetical protein ACRCXZ_03360 [Patescibacteria group bacterium]